ncbi:Transmembrane protein 97 [Coemansia spiralis]|uniref:Efficient mitochondria targeting-associated protein 19 n=1 Tax=Coemansia spiralis TaxID=417178 RepID=A0A9W8GPT9_9FUNG|nr:Transmembrane protein 97 [Coemansia spiralis]
MSAFSRAFSGRHSKMDIVYFIFFVSHIPITLLIDSQPILPVEWIPKPLLALTSFQTDVLGDPFMIVGPRARPDMTWFRSLLACELVLQMPFFFYAAWALWTNCPRRHAPLLIYGVHVATTMLPILSMLYRGNIDRPCSTRAMLAGIYMPYLLIPLAMAYESYTHCAAALSALTKPKKS